MYKFPVIEKINYFNHVTKKFSEVISKENVGFIKTKFHAVNIKGLFS